MFVGFEEVCRANKSGADGYEELIFREEETAEPSERIYVMTSFWTPVHGGK